MNTPYQTKFFKFSALWNLVWGGGILFFHSQVFAYLNIDFTASGVNTAFAQMVGMAVLMFGIFYYLCGVSLEKNQLLCWFGVLGKLGTFFFFFGHYLLDPSLLILAIGGVGDLIFAVLFIRELRTLKERAINPFSSLRDTGL